MHESEAFTNATKKLTSMHWLYIAPPIECYSRGFASEAFTNATKKLTLMHWLYV